MSMNPPTEPFGARSKRRTSRWLVVGGIVVICIVVGLAYGAFSRRQPSAGPTPTVTPLAANLFGFHPTYGRATAPGSAPSATW